MIVFILGSNWKVMICIVFGKFLIVLVILVGCIGIKRVLVLDKLFCFSRVWSCDWINFCSFWWEIVVMEGGEYLFFLIKVSFFMRYVFEFSLEVKGNFFFF